MERLRGHFALLSTEKERNLGGLTACGEIVEARCGPAAEAAACREKWSRTCADEFRIPRDAPVKTSLHLAHVRFEAAEDDTIWQFLNTLPRRLPLPREDIDLLIEEAPGLLAGSATSIVSWPIWRWRGRDVSLKGFRRGSAGGGAPRGRASS